MTSVADKKFQVYNVSPGFWCNSFDPTGACCAHSTLGCAQFGPSVRPSDGPRDEIWTVGRPRWCTTHMLCTLGFPNSIVFGFQFLFFIVRADQPREF